jgi:hypothetical protein
MPVIRSSEIYAPKKLATWRFFTSFPILLVAQYDSPARDHCRSNPLGEVTYLKDSGTYYGCRVSTQYHEPLESKVDSDCLMQRDDDCGEQRRSTRTSSILQNNPMTTEMKNDG